VKQRHSQSTSTVNLPPISTSTVCSSTISVPQPPVIVDANFCSDSNEPSTYCDCFNTYTNETSTYCDCFDFNSDDTYCDCLITHPDESSTPCDCSCGLDLCEEESENEGPK